MSKRQSNVRVPAFLKLAKYRVDFLRHCLSSFGVFNSWQLFRLIRSSPSVNGQTINLPAGITGAPLSLRKSKSDIDAFYKIFAWKEYQLPSNFLPGSVQTIVDLGSNIGLSVFYFASQFPNAKIIGLEPDQENYKLLEANTKHISRCTLLNGGIWNRRASLKIENPNDRPDSYRLCECPPGTPGSLSAYNIPALLEIYNLQEIDLLKVDVEGAEVQLFSNGCEAWLPKVHTLVIELHGDQIREQLVPKIERFFTRHLRVGENDVFAR
jgi:FkbM family methyltransferase